MINQLKKQEEKQKKERIKLIEREWYRNAVTHFSVICGILTIIGLGYGILSYHQTVKPLVDEKELKEKVANLELQNTQLNNNNNFLNEEKTKLNKELSILLAKRDNLENELQSQEEQLLGLQEETILANADAYMSPIIYDLLYSSVISGSSNQNVKEITLEKLDKLSSNIDITESQRKTIDILTVFIHEKIDMNSSYSDLLDYRVFIYDQKLKELSINQEEENN